MELNASNLIQTALEIVIRVLLPVVLGAVVVLIRRGVQVANKYLQVAEAHIDEKNRGVVKMLISELVWAVDQYDIAEKVKRTGAEKKQWVLDRLSVELHNRGIDLNIDLLTDMVEAEVAKMNGQIGKIELPDMFTPLPEKDESGSALPWPETAG